MNLAMPGRASGADESSHQINLLLLVVKKQIKITKRD